MIWLCKSVSSAIIGRARELDANEFELVREQTVEPVERHRARHEAARRDRRRVVVIDKRDFGYLAIVAPALRAASA